MADEEEIKTGNDGVDLPYANEYLNSACYALEILQGVDGKLYSKIEEQRMERSKRRLLRLIHATIKEMDEDYFQKEDKDDDED